MESNVLNSINGIGHERVITVNISNITEWLLKSNFMTIVQFTMGKRHLDTDGRISQQIDSLLSSLVYHLYRPPRRGQGLGKY